VNHEARRALEEVRAILASGVFGSGDIALAVAVVCLHLERLLFNEEIGMSSMFDSEVYAERQRLPGVAINLARLMRHVMFLCQPHKAVLQVEYRSDVETGEWWTLSWGEHRAEATTLELCLFRAAVIARRDDERAKKYAGRVRPADEEPTL
jgi:hypothetical protein